MERGFSDKRGGSLEVIIRESAEGIPVESLPKRVARSATE